MFTVCPKCALTLVVTAADLRVAQGYVRCGRCSSVFNALAQLSDERQAAAAGATAAVSPPAAASAPSAISAAAAASTPPAQEPRRSARTPAGGEPQPPEPPPQAPADEDSIPEDALEFDSSRTDVNSVFVEPSPDPQWTAATGSFKAMRVTSEETAAAPSDAPVEVEIDAAFLSGIVQGEQPRPAAAAVAAPPAPTPRAAPAPETGKSVAARAAGETAAAAVSVAAPRPDESAAEFTDAEADGMLLTPHPLARRLSRLTARESAPWAIGAAVLVIVLVAQAVNHSRDALATHARLNRPLTALYAALGMPLLPHWDLHAYDVRQLGASLGPGSGGEITVRASIRNGGVQPQPLPLLRVTLQDRFGNRLASRDVSPRDYLPGAVPAASFLSVDQRIDAEMAFVDPGSSAVGFEIDACLPTGGGAIACANDGTSR
jgi:predicted Zn finger-like uncharacterized protein